MKRQLDEGSAFRKSPSLQGGEDVNLVCSTALSHAACQPETAKDVIRGPEAATVQMCGMHGQAFLAETALGNLREDEYVKVKCTRTLIGYGNVG